MKALFIALVLTLSGSEASASELIYHRFWIGYKRLNLEQTHFTNDLNESFIPATLALGQNQGLVAYQPVLTLGLHSALPDEVALVSYQDQSAYKTLMSSSAGRAYRSTHWDYFDANLSGSLVPEAFLGKIKLHHAYDLSPEYRDWQKNQTTLVIHAREPQLTEANYLQQIVTELAHSPAQRILRVEAQFWLEYTSNVEHVGVAQNDPHAYFIPIAHARKARVSENQRGFNYQFGL